MANQAIQLRNGANSKPLAFDGIDVVATVTGALAKTSLQQRYCNRDKEPVEIVYEFPLPLQSVLLHLTITLGEKTLRGVVSARQQAEREYEDAVAEGHTAILLKQLSDGLYQINVGNLLPEETCTIALDYVEMLEAHHDALRYRLPTVIAPHYGDPAKVLQASQDVPESNWQASYGMRIQVLVDAPNGSQTKVSSPSHRLIFSGTEQESTLVELDTGAAGNRMDRDFILLIQQAGQHGLTLWQQPCDEGVAVLGLLSTATDLQRSEQASLNLTVVVDCSGSMAGDSIEQARAALLAIIDRLSERDRIAVICFGSSQDVWTPDALVARGAVCDMLRERTLRMDASLGGTEMMPALQKALSLTPVNGEILLITDGESYVADGEIESLANQGRRFFTVGVGSAVSERLVRHLAQSSQGCCELVTPNENMSGRIVQQVYRMRQPVASLSVEWGGIEPVQSYLPSPIFVGDSITFSAFLPSAPINPISVALISEHDSKTLPVTSAIIPELIGDDLPRIVAWQHLPNLQENEATALAVKHQLLTKWTAMTAVLERSVEEQTDGLPKLHKVEQMVPAGWSGSGSVSERSSVMRNSQSSYSVSECSMDMAFSLSEPDHYSYRDLGVRKHSAAISQDIALHNATPQDLLEYLDESDSVRTLLKAWVPGHSIDLSTVVAEQLRVNCARLPSHVFSVLIKVAGEFSVQQSVVMSPEIVYAALIQYLLQNIEHTGLRQYRNVKKLLERSGVDPKLVAGLKERFAEMLEGSNSKQWCVAQSP